MIAGVAIKFNNTLFRLPAPCRHIDILQFIWKKYPGEKVEGGDHQGFYINDKEQTYLNRQQAYIYAVERGQIKATKGKESLFI